MMDKPKECVNRSCRQIIYVPSNQMHLPLQCQQCIDKRSSNDNYYQSHQR